MSPKKGSKPDFSFKEPCVRRWETNRGLRKLAIGGKSLLERANAANTNSPAIPPSLENIRKKYDLLKGYTECMANAGIICTRLVEPLEPPLVAFYELMGMDVSSDRCISVVHGCAITIKKMLRHIRHKWKRWEMPRVPKAKSRYILFFHWRMSNANNKTPVCGATTIDHVHPRILNARTLSWISHVPMIKLWKILVLLGGPCSTDTRLLV